MCIRDRSKFGFGNGFTVTYSADSKVAYRTYGTDSLQYTKDGVTYYNEAGTAIWLSLIHILNYFVRFSILSSKPLNTSIAASIGFFEVMSTPAPLSRSIEYSEQPFLRKSIYLSTAG